VFPVRLSLVTYNLWNTRRWSERAPALKHFVEIYDPDVLCVQELRAETQSFLDATLVRHCRVHDDLPGWTCESNIYWNGELLEKVAHGVDDVGILEEHRRLFWVRLGLRGTDQTIFVSTAHFTYQGNPRERETGLSPRIEQARRTVNVLGRRVHEGEPAFFMGDLNDGVNPLRILRQAGYVSCFAFLGQLSPPTYPCVPTKNIEAGAHLGEQTLDWLVANDRARPVAAQVPHCFHGDIAPSDHWPVLAVYEI
jgi:exonuclease III